MGADLALAALFNRAAAAYSSSPPAYIVYDEFTHVEGHGQTKDLNRHVAVRVSDDYAVMKDLPNGGTTLGLAFPVIPYFDPMSNFSYSYFANIGKLDLKFSPGKPFVYPTPAPSGGDIVVAYFSSIVPHYAPDSTDAAPHFVCDPTPRTAEYFYPSDVREDPATQLPSHISLHSSKNDTTIGFDFSVIDGHWVITRGTYTTIQDVFIGAFRISATTTYSNFAFPDTAPDTRLGGTPNPSPAATASP